MRRKVRRHEEDNIFRNILLVAGSILSLTIIALVITFFVYAQKLNNTTIENPMDYGEVREILSSTNANTLNETTIVSTSIGKTVEEVEETILNNIVEQNTVEGNTNVVSTNVKKEEEKKEPEPVADPTFIKPVEGEIIKEFASENLVFSETLQEWTTHMGIDIASDKATVVKAASAGKIKSIKNDPRYGLTIVMEHNNGYTSVYANLLSSEFVVVGEEIEQGESIGTVGNTATFEIADEYHLHFEILKENVQLDPSLYF